MSVTSVQCRVGLDDDAAIAPPSHDVFRGLVKDHFDLQHSIVDCRGASVPDHRGLPLVEWNLHMQSGQAAPVQGVLAPGVCVWLVVIVLVGVCVV